MSDYLTWLASLDRSELTTLFDNRPEVLRGAPARDLAAVASRLSQHHSVAAALLGQPRPAVQVLTALLVSGGRASVSRCAELLEPAPGSGDHEAQVRDWLGRLAAYGLAWVDGDQVAHLLPAVVAVLDAPDGTLGAPAALLIDEISKDRLAPVLRAWGLPPQTTKAATAAALAAAFADPVRVAAQLALLTPEQRGALVDDTGPAHEHSHEWFQRRIDALTAGKAVGVVLGGYSAYEGYVPIEVRVALRDKALPFDPVEPPLPTTAASPEMVEREGRAALVQFSEACLTILDHVRDRPLAWLRSGGIGAREVSRVAKTCKVEVPVVRLVLECAYAAGLLELHGATLRCGEVAGVWRDLDPGARSTFLIERWPVIAWSPTQTHDAAGKALAVADEGRDCVRCFDGRMSTLAEWVRLSPEQSVHDAALATLVSWVRPLAHTAHREVVEEPDDWGRGYRRGSSTGRALPDPFRVPEGEPTLGAVADEARLLGLVAHGVATPLLRALLAGDRAQFVALADALLPAATGEATFGSDLTAVVTGPPTGALSALLDSCGDRESRGGAVTWRFSTTSVRRALDAGVGADDLASQLAAVATKGIPQPLSYLVADVGRRHGAVRVAPALAVIRCEDEGLLAEVVADRKLRKFGLRLVAPTVAISSAGDEETIEALRAAGYLPMPWVDADVAADVTPGAPGAPGAPGVTPGGTTSDETAVINLASRRALRGQAAAGHLGPRSDQDAVDDQLERLIAQVSSGVRQGDRIGPPTVAPDPETPEAAAARLVGTVRQAPPTGPDRRLVVELRRVNRVLSDDEIEILAQAVVDLNPVVIRYRSSSGSITDRVISDLAYSGQMLDAWCHLRGDARTFLASEILAVDYP